MADSKQRWPNWTEEERIFLVEAVNRRGERLFGKFKGCGATKGSKLKEQAWEEVAEALNAKSGIIKRTVDETRKQYANLKQRAKEKSDAIRRPKTGGGPKPASPSPAENKIIDDMADRPTLQGLTDGIDSEVLNCVVKSLLEGSLPEVDSHECTSTQNSTLPVDVIIDKEGFLHVPKSSTGPSKSRKRKLDDTEHLVLEAEMEKFKMECKKLEQELNYFKIKSQVEELKKQKLELEIMKLRFPNEQEPFVTLIYILTKIHNYH